MPFMRAWSGWPKSMGLNALSDDVAGVFESLKKEFTTNPPKELTIFIVFFKA